MILDYKLSLWNRKKMCDVIMNDFFVFIKKTHNIDLELNSTNHNFN